MSILKLYTSFTVILIALLCQNCSSSGAEDNCSNRISYSVFEAFDDSRAYNYVKQTLDNNCKIDSNLTNLFAITCIGRDDLYFFKAHKVCCERSTSNNELGYCNGYLAEHYFKTNRFDMAAETYGMVLSSIFSISQITNSDNFCNDFIKLTKDDQNLYLTCLYSRANSYFRMGKSELSAKDLDIGLMLSNKVNPIFLESFKEGFN